MTLYDCAHCDFTGHWSVVVMTTYACVQEDALLMCSGPKYHRKERLSEYVSLGSVLASIQFISSCCF